MGALLASGLTGCCSLRKFPPDEIVDERTSARIQPVLRPRRISSNGKPTPYCLDVHTHFFNASDINVEGYLKGPIARHIRNKRLRQFVERMSPVLDELAGMAPRAPDEYAWLNQQVSAAPARTLAEPDMLDAQTDQYRDVVAREVFDAMNKRGLGEEFRTLVGEQAKSLGIAPDAPQEQQFSESTVRQAIDPIRRRAARVRLYGPVRSATTQAPDPTGVLEFIGHMLGYRWMALRSYQRLCTEDEEAFGIDAVFSALVDFDHYLACPARSSREDQMKLHALMSLASGGYLLPLVGYNPWTDIKRAGSSLELVKRAVREYGFVGVKIYPPIGYLPYGNADAETGSTLPRPDGSEADKRLKALFAWCAQEGVPVMAHANESRGRDDASDAFSGPQAWGVLLREFEGKTPPIINAAHFGGDAPKSADAPNRWPAQFAALAAKPSGARLYGDLGYWSALHHCSAGQLACDAALRRLKDALAANPAMVERIMFGTDWFMLSIESDWAAYPGDLEQQLATLVPPEKLFYENAMHCFGLARGGAQRERILGILREVPGGPPPWLSAV